ncbi:structural maintenance of chromosomes protein 5 [Hordeum vulgare subsp. vulgare]|uniref:Structural maintenance of chromosomes protein 5 n=1 Tax=Hordeum vulgare subsp. vulgare TaxID=112509 RepID=A0A8I6W8U6_HORVV|nr:structural maintenance of chromosomes protein 5 [Hordeum vulgare subsp. vulgare]
MAPARAAKRPKLEPSASASGAQHQHRRGDDDYVPGNIVEIELCNFMTYDRLVCRPGPRLNLVVGPNGSGKSSLVCAIALALAADPSILGRASSVGAFVKRGEESGHVRLSLRSQSQQASDIHITRKIDTNNKSEWLLDGATVPKKDIIDVIKKFNIQINNLTQFLPQDRVCEFAKLTPIQLLEETEKAVGDPNLPVQHRQLIERSRELRNIEVAVKQKEQTLNNLKALNAEQEKDVQRVRQRDKLLKKAELMKKKLPWLKYDAKKLEFKNVLEEEKIYKKKMDDATKIWLDAKAPIEGFKKEKTTITSSMKKINNQINQNTNKRREVTDDEIQLSARLKTTFDDIEELKRHEKNQQQKISKAKEALAAAERELQDLQPFEPPRAEMAQLTVDIGHKICGINEVKFRRKEKEQQLSQERENLRKCSDRLMQMESKNNKLLQALQRAGAERINEAYYWVQNNKNMFRGEVYGPVLLEVNVHSKTHAGYLESHVPNYIWRSFITQNASDRDLLVRQLKQYGTPILNYTGGNSIMCEPLNITPEMKQLGITSRLDQEFEAPPAVKNVLITQALVDQSYIGTNQADKSADDVVKLGINDLWTPRNHYRWSRSRYGGHLSANVDSIYPSRLFMCDVNVSDIEMLRSEKDQHAKNVEGMEEALKELQKDQRKLEDEEAEFRKRKEAITDKVRIEKKKREDIQRRVDLKRRTLEDMAKEEDVESSTRRLTDQLAKLNDDRFRSLLKLKNLLVEAVALKWSYTEKNMASIELDTKIWEMEKDVKKHEKDVASAAKDYENRQRITQEHRQAVNKAKQHAESVSIITDNLEKEFEKMPTTIEELELAIQDTESEANSMLFLNQNVLQEYQNRKREIESISTKLEDDKAECERCCSEIETTKGKWLPTLRSLVLKINDTFSRNFQEMAVAGEVSLDEHGLDFSQYGILIKVKFRQTGQLQVLSAHHQSGGERSVSTILYLVSLQDLTNCPFRVVDEINQGMDPINERKMFQQLVRAASQLNTPQCFLLTPKLLPDLEYSDACSILNIMNGPWIEKPAHAWRAGDNWRTVTGMAGSGN